MDTKMISVPCKLVVKDAKSVAVFSSVDAANCKNIVGIICFGILFCPTAKSSAICCNNEAAAKLSPITTGDYSRVKQAANSQELAKTVTLLKHYIEVDTDEVHTPLYKVMV